MFSKLRVVMILLMVVLIGAGPVAALDGARDEGAPAVLAWVVQPLEASWTWISNQLYTPGAEILEVRTQDGDAEGDGVSTPPLDEVTFVIRPGG